MNWKDGKILTLSINHSKKILIHKDNKMTKTQILKVIKETAAPHKLDREQKFQVFANVCDNMLAEGRITQEQHIRWTNIFWGHHYEMGS